MSCGRARSSTRTCGRRRASTRQWIQETAEIIQRAQQNGPASDRVDAVDAAERLTALVEGLSERWLSGSMALDRARTLLRGGIANELDTPNQTPHSNGL